MKKRTKRRIIWGVVALAFILALVVIFKPKTSGPLDGVAKDVFLVKQETVQKRTLKHAVNVRQYQGVGRSDSFSARER